MRILNRIEEKVDNIFQKHKTECEKVEEINESKTNQINENKLNSRQFKKIKKQYLRYLETDIFIEDDGAHCKE